MGCEFRSLISGSIVSRIFVHPRSNFFTVCAAVFPWMWEFSVGMYMINVWPDSLILTAAYGVIESASIVVLGPLIGQWVDKLSYLKVLKLWLLAQNLSFIVAGVAEITILVCKEFISANLKLIFVSLVIIINISGAIGVLSALGGSILIEREWVVVMSKDQPSTVLTSMNSILRRIDLTCTLFAPVISGLTISFVSMTASAITLALWNMLSVSSQYKLLMSVYNGIPVLKQADQRRLSLSSSFTEDAKIKSTHRREVKSLTSSEYSDLNQQETIIERFIHLPYFSTWRVYIQQDVVLPGLSLALLYFTVLSFGTLMTAKLEWQGIPAYVIGIARGISAIVGISATFVYPMLESRISTLRTGLWSIWSQWACLLLCVASVYIRERNVAAYTLMSGVALSRLGLWMFDLSVIQQMQDHVQESDRCIVGGVQNSLQSLLDLMTYITCILISNPQDFWKLIMMSFTHVTVAAILYSVYAYRVQKSKFNYEKLFQLVQYPLSSS